MSEIRTVYAYDSTGNTMRPTRVEVGDSVDYKRQGQRGSIRCAVEGVCVDGNGRTKLVLRPPAGRRFRSTIGFLAVYDWCGKRREPER